MNNEQRVIKIFTYTAPITNGFRTRVDTSFEGDRELDKAWEWVNDALDAWRAEGKWPWAQTPESLLKDIRTHFECNNLYDIMRLGNEAVFLKFEAIAKYSMATSRPKYGVRELTARTFWSVELVNKDLLEEVTFTSPAKL